MDDSAFARIVCSEALTFWLDSRKTIAPGTRRDYQECIKHLVKFFGQLPLRDIHIGHIQSYQEFRKLTNGPMRINREVGVLGSVLAQAGLWTELKPVYHRLLQPKSKRGIALEPEEEATLWKIAASNPRWQLVYWCSVLARNTCMGTKEIRMLRLKAIDQQEFQWVRVEEGLKNKYRERTIRCNPDAGWALRNLIERAARLGDVDPEHYLLPHRARKGKRGGDPTKPQESFLFSWRKLRTELAKKYPHLARLRFYDNRHTACTRLLENPSVPYNAVEHMMGHELNSKTKRIYDHVRNTTLHAASEALSSGHIEIPSEPTPYLVERKPPRKVSSSPPLKTHQI